MCVCVRERERGPAADRYDTENGKHEEKKEGAGTRIFWMRHLSRKVFLFFASSRSIVSPHYRLTFLTIYIVLSRLGQAGKCRNNDGVRENLFAFIRVSRRIPSMIYSQVERDKEDKAKTGRTRR